MRARGYIRKPIEKEGIAVLGVGYALMEQTAR
jgi:hypothetical protein